MIVTNALFAPLLSLEALNRSHDLNELMRRTPL